MAMGHRLWGCSRLVAGPPRRFWRQRWAKLPAILKPPAACRRMAEMRDSHYR
jgi:hypothetical protein